MNYRRIIFTAVALVTSLSVYAQRHKATISLDYDDWIDKVPVPYEFSYINGKDGAILDGPFTMYKHNEIDQVYEKIHWCTGLFSYKLAGSHSQGKLHGPLTMTYHVKLSATNGDNLDEKRTFKGNFTNGIPNGNFVVDYGEDSYAYDMLNYCNVTYKNGKLVGKYVTKGRTGYNNAYEEISGTLTSDGKMNGTWVFGKWAYENNLHQYMVVKSNKVFQNNVLVSDEDYDATLKSFAKSYASGQISKEQLLDKGILVEEESSLQANARILILTEKYIKWKVFGDYDFYSDTTQVGYEYLRYIPTINDEGIDYLAKEYKSVYQIDSVQVFLNFDEEIERYYIPSTRDIDSYSTGVKEYDRRTYLTPAQADKLIQVLSAKVEETKLLKLKKLLNDRMGKSNFPRSRYGRGEFSTEALYKCVPYNRYTIKDIRLRGSDDPDYVDFVATVQFYKSDSNSGDLQSSLLRHYDNTAYELTMYFCKKGDVIFPLTFTRENVRYIETHWDHLNKLTDNLKFIKNKNEYVDAALSKYGSMLKNLADTESRKTAKTIEKYVNTLSSEYNSIMKYKNVINTVLDSHEKVQRAVAGVTDVENIYVEYFAGLDLNWTQTEGIQPSEGTYSWEEKLSHVLDVQDNVFVFAEKRNLIAANDAAINARVGVAKNICKAYSAYYSVADLTLPSDFSEGKVDEVLKIQNEVKNILERADIAAVAKNVRKAKLTDISSIISFVNATETADVEPKEEAASVTDEPETRVKEQSHKTEKPKKQPVAKEYRSKGLINTIQFNMQRSMFAQPNCNMIGGDYMIGYRFSHNFTLSAGLGFSMITKDTTPTLMRYVDQINSGAASPYFNGTWIKEVRDISDCSSKVFLPVYLNAKYYFTKGGVQPFVSASAGVYVIPSIFPKTEVGVGCNFRFANRLSAYVLVSIDTSVSPQQTMIQNYSEPDIVDLEVCDKADFLTPSIKVGFSF